MLGHLGINVTDLAAARTYYNELMPVVGFELFLDDHDQFAFRPAAGKPGTYLFFYPAGDSAPYARDRAGLQHLAFMVKSRSAVRDVHRLVQTLGGEIVHEPQVFPQYPPPYFATFWLDPFGLMLEAVCHHDRE
ncbi:catechol 2,3-dioxygenase-like lactoylglutathione lyase family enzyme [Mycobacterium sp. BK086]|uniref:VOC family protein n=1 Tax=Mycobacterium sp. BK086 TaxID=2512165 RepID=UPI00106202D6|nr:VOC family protein [Mycobacterium sp. BK086]TDO18020.1 catechol 2,3-dioxygenase-like lactoylglutathione lyase family enzyme [Mycobacterium sp. BK086]